LKWNWGREGWYDGNKGVKAEFVRDPVKDVTTDCYFTVTVDYEPLTAWLEKHGEQVKGRIGEEGEAYEEIIGGVMVMFNSTKEQLDHKIIALQCFMPDVQKLINDGAPGLFIEKKIIKCIEFFEEEFGENIVVSGGYIC